MKTTLAGMMILWASIFFPGNKSIILNMKKESAKRNIEVIQEMLENLPEWMVPKKVYKGEKQVTQIILWNSSSIKVFYPSTIHKPTTIARALTAPILYIDEAAFITHMQEIFTGAAPTLFRAQEQAKMNKYPYFTFITSTPNGKAGMGEWFYNRWENAIESDELFEYNEDFDGYYWKPEYLIGDISNSNSRVDVAKLERIATANDHNNYIRVRYHWSEDPYKDEQWYNRIKAELSDPRIVNQELNLVFVGGQRSILSDEIIQQFDPQEKIAELTTPNYATLRIYEEIDPLEYYIIGVDTATETSKKSAFNALQIMRFSDLTQVAELHHRHGSFRNWADDIEYIFAWLHDQVQNRIIIGVEINTIGKSTYEHLVLDRHRKFNFKSYMYSDDEKNQKFGIYTNKITKATMVKALFDVVKLNPKIVKSKYLIDQLSSIEATNTVNNTVTSPGFMDLFMAACFCALVREKKWLEIAPYLNKTQQDVSQRTLNNIKIAFKANNIQNFDNTREPQTMYGMPVIEINNDKKDDVTPEELLRNDQITHQELQMFKIIGASYKDSKDIDLLDPYEELYNADRGLNFFGGFSYADEED